MAKTKMSGGRRVVRAGVKSKQSERVRINLRQKIFSKASLIAVLIILGILLAGLITRSIYHRVYASPQTVFWQTINNNLATPGITETTESKQQNINNQKVSQIAFSPGPVVRQETKQLDSNTGGIIKREIIGSRSADYLRIDQVSNLKQGDSSDRYKSLYSLWVKNPSYTPFPETLNETLLNSPAMFANLNSAQRKNLFGMLQKVYVIENYQKQPGHTYDFRIAINLRMYFKVVKVYAQMLGLPGASSISPQVYKTGDKARFNFLVGGLNRQLKQVSSSDKTSQVSYSAYGQQVEITLPQKTIDAATFSEKVNALQK